MYAKALRKGFFDLAGNGSFVEIKPGQVIQIPDTVHLKPTSWLVKCDKQGNVLDAAVVRKDAEKARQKADREAEQARTAAANADKQRKEAEAAEKRAKELEEAATKGGQQQTQEPPK